jgi:hypothetical protein
MQHQDLMHWQPKRNVNPLHEDWAIEDDEYDGLHRPEADVYNPEKVSPPLEIFVKIIRSEQEATGTSMEYVSMLIVFLEGCRVWQPTLRQTGKTGSSYLRCTEVGT